MSAFTRLFTCHHETPTTADRLTLALADLHTANSALARLKTRLDHYIGQTLAARHARDCAEREARDAQACLLEAIRERDEAYRAGLAQADEVRDLQRSRVLLTDIAEGLRDELRELRAAVTIGAAQKKGKR